MDVQERAFSRRPVLIFIEQESGWREIPLPWTFRQENYLISESVLKQHCRDTKMALVSTTEKATGPSLLNPLKKPIKVYWKIVAVCRGRSWGTCISKSGSFRVDQFCESVVHVCMRETKVVCIVTFIVAEHGRCGLWL